MQTDAIATGVKTYRIDPEHTTIQFRVRLLGFSRVTGWFRRFEGKVLLHPLYLSTLQAAVQIETASVDTGSEARDAHLRSADFFDADTFPEMTFASTAVRDVGVDAFRLEGVLSLHGVERPVVLEATYLGESADPWGGGRRVAFEAYTRFNRHDFGLGWNQFVETGSWLVGDDVEVELAVQAVEVAETGGEAAAQSRS